MRRVILSSILGLGALAAAGSAEAQVIYNQPPAGSYGGGLVELLMTGRDPTPGVRQRVYPAASPTGEFYQPRAPQGSHIAAVSSAPTGVEETGVGRAADPKYRRKPWSGAALTSPERSSSIRPASSSTWFSPGALPCAMASA